MLDISESHEVGLTGVALPIDVELLIPPLHRDPHDPNSVTFADCGVGSSSKVTLKLTNRSTELPATFQFRRIAHFSCQPARKCLQPGQSVDILVNFAPRQMGQWSTNNTATLCNIMYCV